MFLSVNELPGARFLMEKVRLLLCSAMRLDNLAVWTHVELAGRKTAQNVGMERHQRKWWAWVDSNYRPHPYQGCALTT